MLSNNVIAILLESIDVETDHMFGSVFLVGTRRIPQNMEYSASITGEGLVLRMVWGVYTYFCWNIIQDDHSTVEPLYSGPLN